MAVPLISILVVHSFDDLVAMASFAARILIPEMEVVCQRTEPTDGNVCEDDPVPKSIPWFVDSSILFRRGYWPPWKLNRMVRRTTLEVTAPFKLPHPIAMPRTALRL